MDDVTQTIACADCGTPQSDDPRPCSCGSTRRAIRIEIQEEAIKARDELRGTVREQGGDVVQDFSQRGDDKRDSSVSVDFRAGTMTVAGAQGQRAHKDDEQRQVLEAFAAAQGRRLGREFRCELDGEDREADGWVWPADEPDRRQALQLRNLDDAAIAAIQSTGRLNADFGFADLVAAARKALASKATQYPAAVKEPMILILHVPYPLVDTLVPQMRSALRDDAAGCGYREVWVVPFREPPFRLDGDSENA
jgi:hypothetical protein